MLSYPGICKSGIASIGLIPFHVCKNLTLIHIVSGQLQFTTVAGRQTLQEGQTEILNVKEPVMMEATGAPCRILYFCFDDIFLLNTDVNFEWVTYNCNICNFFCATAQKEHIDTLTGLLLRFMEKASKDMSLVEAEKKTGEILHYIMKHFDDVGHVFSENPKEDISKERFQRISSYMIANVTNKISLRDIAQNEYLSTPYLSKEFSAKLEKNYHTIINYYRTINTVIQLLDTDHTLTYIAETSGFSSVRYYNKVFSSFLGCLPSKFRSLYKGNPQNASDETVTAAELQEISASFGKQSVQTNIKILLPPDGQKIKRFTCRGSHKEARPYTFTFEGAPNTEKGVVLYIEDDLSRSVEHMATDANLLQSAYGIKLQGPRKEVRHLSASESEMRVVLWGKWKVELYIIW